jgi:hypothetical protein
MDSSVRTTGTTCAPTSTQVNACFSKTDRTRHFGDMQPRKVDIEIRKTQTSGAAKANQASEASHR